MGFSEHIPFMAGETHVLHHMHAMQTVCTLKIKGPEIKTFIVTVILSTESDTNKTLSRNIFTPQININPAVCKRNILQPGVALQTKCRPVGTVGDLNQLFGAVFSTVVI